jgi:hypothetical protein
LDVSDAQRTNRFHSGNRKEYRVRLGLAAGTLSGAKFGERARNLIALVSAEELLGQSNEPEKSQRNPSRARPAIWFPSGA